MRDRLICLVILVFCFLPSWAGAGSSSLSGQDAYQEGLYLQYTRGDLYGALDSYGRALLGAGPGEHADRLVLSQLECLGWIGQRSQSIEIIKQLQSESSKVATALGPTRFFPSGMQLLLSVDARQFGLNQVLQDANLDLECGDGKTRIKDLLAESGLASLEGVKTVAVGMSFSDDDAHPVDHWLLRVDYRQNKDRPVAWEDVIAFFLSKMCEKKAGGGVPKVDFSRKRRKLLNRDVVIFESISPAWATRLDIVLVDFHDGTMLLGDMRAVTDTLLAMDFQNPGLRANQTMCSMIPHLPADSAFWILVSPDEISSRLRSLRSVLGWAGAVPVIDGVMLYGQWAGDFVISATAWTSDVESALSLGELAKGAVALLNLSSFAERRRDERIARVLAGIKIKVEPSSIHLSISIPGSLLMGKTP